MLRSSIHRAGKVAQMLIDGGKPLADMSDEEMRSALQAWRNLWSWVPEDVQRWTTHIGEYVRAVGRDYKPKEGELKGFGVQITYIDMGISEVVTRWDTGDKFYEEKTLRLSTSAMIFWELITAHENVQATIDSQAEQVLTEIEHGESLPF